MLSLREPRPSPSTWLQPPSNSDDNIDFKQPALFRDSNIIVISLNVCIDLIALLLYLLINMFSYPYAIPFSVDFQSCSLSFIDFQGRVVLTLSDEWYHEVSVNPVSDGIKN